MLTCRTIIRLIPSLKNQKHMIHNLGNVECIELSEIPPETRCPHCPKCWTEGIVYCACGTRLIPKAFTRCLTRERFDALTIPDVVIKKGTRRGARHGENEAQRKYKQAKDCSRKALKNKKKTPSSSGSNRAKRTETRSKPSDGTKKPADVLTVLHAKTTPTSLLGKLALNIQRPTDFYESKIGLVLTQSKISTTSDKKMIKSPILQFTQANKFANVQYGKTRRDGIQHLIDELKRIIHMVVFSRIRKTSVIFQGFRSRATAIRL